MKWWRKRRGLKYIYLHLETKKTGPEELRIQCSGPVSHVIPSYKAQIAWFPWSPICSIEQPRHYQSLWRLDDLVNTNSYTSVLYYCPTSIINIGLITCHIWFSSVSLNAEMSVTHTQYTCLRTFFSNTFNSPFWLLIFYLYTALITTQGYRRQCSPMDVGFNTAQ